MVERHPARKPQPLAGLVVAAAVVDNDNCRRLLLQPRRSLTHCSGSNFGSSVHTPQTCQGEGGGNVGCCHSKPAPALHRGNESPGHNSAAVAVGRIDFLLTWRGLVDRLTRRTIGCLSLQNERKKIVFFSNYTYMHACPARY